MRKKKRCSCQLAEDMHHQPDLSAKPRCSVTADQNWVCRCCQTDICNNSTENAVYKDLSKYYYTSIHFCEHRDAVKNLNSCMKLDVE